MSSFSSIAEIISGHAVSEAKRYDCDLVSELHLLSAIRRWQEEQFDQKFPGVGDSMLVALKAGRGESIKTPVIDSKTAQRLQGVMGTGDVWSLALELIDETKDQRELSITKVGKTAVQGQENLDSNQVSDGDRPSSPADVIDSLPFGINLSLIERIASISGKPLAETTSLVLHDAVAVAVLVIGKQIDDLVLKIQTASGLVYEEVNASNEISELVKEISLVADASAGKCATQLALALVEVGEWAAAIEDGVSAEEIDRIDEVRINLRNQLGERIDTESAAIAAFEQKFARLIGMESVKTDLRKRLDFLVVNRRREKRGLKADVHRMHMAFLGNPGTGKTTVARLFGELLNEMGLLPTKKFIETDRSGLIGQYVGQTEKKTLEQINAADGGVLFIDEAYALDDGYENMTGYGFEATSVLVKQMEDRRQRLVVILAGYTEPTTQYILKNPGMKSRIPTMITFSDYSVEELRQIALRIATDRDLILGEESLDLVVKVVVSQKSTEGFGNARAVENVLEGAQRNSINRTSSLGNLATEREIKTILPEDIPKMVSSKKKQFGFSPSSNKTREEE